MQSLRRAAILAGAVPLLAVSMLIPVNAQDTPKFKMTTEIPDGITTPDNIETQLGDLNFFDGVPEAKTTEKIYNLLDFTHAYQAYMDGTKIASIGP